MGLALKVKTKGLKAMIQRQRARVKRAKTMPRRYIWETSDRIAALHHHGGRQTVDRPMQRAIARRTGETPPRVGAVLVHPRRPVRATPKMAKRVAVDLARYIMRGGKRKVRMIMLEEIVEQFQAGGQPAWAPARSWGRQQARQPTLGGSGSRPLAGWRRRGRYREAR